MAAAVLGFLLFWAAAPAQALPFGEVVSLGRRIWHNECRGTVSGLTSWNDGEEFASLGIGHFIWYPEGQQGPFQESFPLLLEYLERQGVTLPEWLTVSVGSPWASREEFLAQRRSERMLQLRRLLAGTTGLQARFIVARLESALPKMLTVLPPEDRERVSSRFHSLARQRGGVYALVDYVNFKGEGLKPQERYNGQAWGLLQVLQEMRQPTVAEFAAAADRVLTRRVLNSPPERNEARWLPGWRMRLKTYRAES